MGKDACTGKRLVRVRDFSENLLATGTPERIGALAVGGVAGVGGADIAIEGFLLCEAADMPIEIDDVDAVIVDPGRSPTGMFRPLKRRKAVRGLEGAEAIGTLPDGGAIHEKRLSGRMSDILDSQRSVPVFDMALPCLDNGSAATLTSR